MTIKAFVTGGTGFIGANLIRSLIDAGYSVKALVRHNSKLGNLEGLDVEIVRDEINSADLDQYMHNCQVLFHVAAHYSLWQNDRELLYQNNVIGTRNILQAARSAGIDRTVYTSSVAAIGVGKKGEIVDENHQSAQTELVGDYKKSKFLAEQEAKQAVAKGQDIVIVNPSTPIGPLDIKPTPTGEIILRFLRRQMPAYVETGLNLIDVRDVARGHILALEKGKTGDRYILGNENITFKALLDLLAAMTGLEAPKTTIPIWLPLTAAWIDEKMLTPLGKTPSLPLDGVRMSKQPMYYNSAKAVKELNLPQSSIAVALQDAVDWFISNGYLDAHK